VSAADDALREAARLELAAVYARPVAPLDHQLYGPPDPAAVAQLLRELETADCDYKRADRARRERNRRGRHLKAVS
jgi:hypothetical protein